MAISRGLPGLTLEEMMNQLKEDTTGEPVSPAKQLPEQVGTTEPLTGIDLNSTVEWVEVEVTPES